MKQVVSMAQNFRFELDAAFARAPRDVNRWCPKCDTRLVYAADMKLPEPTGTLVCSKCYWNGTDVDLIKIEESRDAWNEEFPNLEFV